MTRWKKDEKEFPVKLTNDHAGSILCRVPKPILDLLGKPSHIKFIISSKEKVSVVVAKGKRKMKQKNVVSGATRRPVTYWRARQK